VFGARLIWPVAWLDWAFRVVILWWAGRELLQGATPFRRTIGLVVIGAVATGIVRSLSGSA
jgi:hypothetical protein